MYTDCKTRLFDLNNKRDYNLLVSVIGKIDIPDTIEEGEYMKELIPDWHVNVQHYDDFNNDRNKSEEKGDEEVEEEVDGEVEDNNVVATLGHEEDNEKSVFDQSSDNWDEDNGGSEECGGESDKEKEIKESHKKRAVEKKSDRKVHVVTQYIVLLLIVK